MLSHYRWPLVAEVGPKFAPNLNVKQRRYRKRNLFSNSIETILAWDNVFNCVFVWMSQKLRISNKYGSVTALKQ
jgi:hypothetical protein